LYKEKTMSVDKSIEKRLVETVNVSSMSYADQEHSFVPEDCLSTGIDALSALEDLSRKLELCLKKQRQVNFISREIAEIVKKSS